MKEKNRIGEIPLPPELDSVGMDNKADLVLININSNTVEAMTPNEAKSRLNKYDKIIKRLNGILEKPIDEESEIYKKMLKYRRLREKLLIGISEFEAKTGQVLINKPKKATKQDRESLSFPLFDYKDLEWQDIQIDLISDSTVRLVVKRKNYSERFMFADLDLKDGRKVDLPNILWELLKQLSINNGLLDGLSFTGRSKLEKTISRLRVHLRKLTGVDGDPIPFNGINKSYKTKFSIIDKRPDISQSHREEIESNLISKLDTYEKPDY